MKRTVCSRLSPNGSTGILAGQVRYSVALQKLSPILPGSGLVVAVDPDVNGAMCALRTFTEDSTESRIWRSAEAAVSTSMRSLSADDAGVSSVSNVQRFTGRLSRLVLDGGMTEEEALQTVTTELKSGAWKRVYAAVLAFPLKQLKEAANALGLMHASSKKEAMTDQIFSALIQEADFRPEGKIMRPLIESFITLRGLEPEPIVPCVWSDFTRNSRHFRVVLADNPSIDVPIQGAARKRPSIQGIIEAVREMTTRCGLPDEDELDSVSVALVEQPLATPGNGSLGSIQSGFNYGVHTAVLCASGLNVQHVTPRAWKSTMGLINQDKDASRFVAMKLFPTVADVLSLKKAHGRAEALLLAAYATGLRLSDEQWEEVEQCQAGADAGEPDHIDPEFN